MRLGRGARRPARRARHALGGPGGPPVLLAALVLACRAEPPYEPRYHPAPEPEPPVFGEPDPSEIAVTPIQIPLEDPPPVPRIQEGVGAPSAAEIARRIRRAGRTPLAGLPAVREAARKREEQRALDDLRTELEGEYSHLWLSRFVEILTGGERTDDELWCATARVVGGLGRYDIARHLVPPLADAPTSRRRSAAQIALHMLYGRWFSKADEVAPFLSSVAAGPGTALLLQGGEAAEAEARERLLAELRHEPLAAETWFQDPDPLVRAGVARVVGEVLHEVGEEDRARLLELVSGRLEVEIEPRAFHAALQTVAGSLESAPPDAPELVWLREVMVGEMREATDARCLSVAQALARLPWATEGPPGPAHLLTGVEVLGEILDGIDAADQQRGEPDPDLMLGVLQSLQVLCDRANGSGLAAELRRNPARAPIFAILQDDQRDATVRAAAVTALGSFALPEDWEFLVDLLHRNDTTPALSHALLGALPSILRQFQPDEPGAEALLAEVAELAGAADPDLRRRALALLEDERMTSLVSRLDPRILVERLAQEEVPDLSRTVLRLLRRLGTPEMLDAVLATHRFDEIAAGGPQDIGELAETLLTLAGGRAKASMRAALRLTEVQAEHTRVTRTRFALSIVAALSDEAVQELDPEDHRLICAWAWRLQEAGVPIDEATPQGLAFVERLEAVHWRRSAVGFTATESEREFGEPARHHLRAIAVGILAAAGVEGSSIEDAEECFARALKFAPAQSPELELYVRRDRARFRAAVGDVNRALADYRELIEADFVEIPDLRVAIGLLTSVGGKTTAGQRAVAPEMFDLYGRVVGRPTWHDELPMVRIQDLRDLSENALRARDPERMKRFVAALDGLPDAPPADAAPPADPPLWSGLARNPDWLEELRRMRDKVRAALEKETQVIPAAQRE